MIRRVPILPTLLVAAAVGVMIWLGFWQLDRLGEKEAQLARYNRSLTMSSEAPWPKSAAERELALYRHSQLSWAHIAHCVLTDGSAADVALGWSSDPRTVSWQGGEVTGFVGPSGKGGVRLVAAPAQAGLAQLAAPDPRDVPNNHLSYAVQWFLFAATALVIYALALRKRWREGA